MKYLPFFLLLLFAAPAFALECVVAGCSSQLCVEKSVAANTVSTCEWTEAYACYAKTSQCVAQLDANGRLACGWLQTPELSQCLQRVKGPAPIRNIQ